MFERVDGGRPETVTILIGGRPVPARTTDTVAAALLAAGVPAFRVNAADGSPRGPYCLMGVCQECHLVIDGEPDVPACTTPVHDGMRISLSAAVDDG